MLYLSCAMCEYTVVDQTFHFLFKCVYVLDIQYWWFVANHRSQVQYRTEKMELSLCTREGQRRLYMDYPLCYMLNEYNISFRLLYG